MKNKVTAISVNFKTPKLIHACVSSFSLFYPEVRHIVVDNGGCPESFEMMEQLEIVYGVHVIESKTNIGHGPALDIAIREAKTPYVFTLDSDTECIHGEFLEKMVSQFDADPDLFALGWLRYVNKNGVATPRQWLKQGDPYVHPFASMLDRRKYLELEPFSHRGAPAVDLMRSAVKKGYGLENYPIIKKYIWHKEAGTRGHFGGTWKPETDGEKQEWRKFRI